MISVVKSAIEALTIFLILKNRLFFYDINQKSRDRQQALINEIEKLRKSSASGDHHRADILRAQLVEEREYITNISAYYTLTGERKAD
jgi:hypothetical protein